MMQYVLTLDAADILGLELLLLQIVVISFIMDKKKWIYNHSDNIVVIE